MKKIFAPLVLLATICSCTNEDLVLTENHLNPSSNQNIKIELTEAVDMALDAANHLYPTVSSRGADSKRAVANAKFITFPSKSRSGERDTLMYVVNFEDNAGFAIISARRCKNNVLAVVGEGDYNPEIGTENPGFRYFLDLAENYIQTSSVFDSNIEIDTLHKRAPEYETVIDTLHYYHCNPKLGELTWGQDYPYNLFCENGASGCAPTAINQIIGYFNFQLHGNQYVRYDFPGRDIDSQYIDWQEFIRHKRSAVTYPNGTTVSEICYAQDHNYTHYAIARMMRQVGKDINAIYLNSGGTWGNKESYKACLEKYLPNLDISQLTGFQSKYVTRHLDWGLLLMCGDILYGIGHVWVADGYDYLDYVENCYEIDPVTGWRLRLYSSSTNIRSMTHMRWGWNGFEDGYYANDVFDAAGNHFVQNEYIAVVPPH